MGRKRGSPADKTEMIRWLFENSGDLMHVAHPDGVLKLVNPAWERVLGWREDEVVGRAMVHFIHAEDMSDVRARVRGMEVGEVRESQVRLLRKSGDYLWMACRAQKMPDGSMIVSMREATADRARADELDEARRTRKMLGAAAGIGQWTFDPATGLSWWSEELEALTGLQAKDYATLEAFSRRLHPDERAMVLTTLGEGVDNGVAAQFEHQLRARQGWITVRATFHCEAAPGGGYALKGLSQDITELARARDAARKGERRMRAARKEAMANAERLKLALKAADAGVYEIDHINKTFWCSPEFKRITGRGRASYKGATQLRYPGFHPDDLEHVRESFRELHRGGRRSGEAFDARIVRPDGSERWVRLFHHLRVSKNGRWLKAAGLILDFDQRKRQELALLEAQRAAEAAGEAKSAFLANMSHEIRTPMNGVMGVLHLLKHENLSDEGRSMLDEALNCGAMLAELLNDVIDFSKIEAGRLELASEPVCPAQLAEGVVRLLKPIAQAKGLSLTLDGDLAALGWVRSDPVRLRQALFNLVGNAVKFTEVGYVKVRCVRTAEGRLRFEVEDTGVGIPDQVQARIFQRFDQGDASTTRRFGGSGLGLAITKKLAEMMSGVVGFTSKEGQGSTFWMEVDAPAAAAPLMAEDTFDQVLEGLRILVVEDNATNRMIATKMLEHLGASVETAPDGYQGVEAAARGGFDLVLMDVQMPGMDGVEAVRRIRALESPAARTPVVALTANVLSHQRHAYLEAGMDGVVGKPISPAALLTEIARLSQPAPQDSEAAA